MLSKWVLLSYTIWLQKANDNNNRDHIKRLPLYLKYKVVWSFLKLNEPTALFLTNDSLLTDLFIITFFTFHFSSSSLSNFLFWTYQRFLSECVFITINLLCVGLLVHLMHFCIALLKYDRTIFKCQQRVFHFLVEIYYNFKTNVTYCAVVVKKNS